MVRLPLPVLYQLRRDAEAVIRTTALQVGRVHTVVVDCEGDCEQLDAAARHGPSTVALVTKWQRVENGGDTVWRRHSLADPCSEGMTLSRGGVGPLGAYHTAGRATTATAVNTTGT